MVPRWVKWLAVLAALAFALLIPKLLSSFYVDLLSQVLIYGLLAMSIDLLAGYTGLVPLGHAGIFGIAAYVVAYLMTKDNTSAYLAVPLGVVASTFAAAVFALLAIRTTGIYFLMVTLAEGMIVWGVAYRWSSVTNAENGISGIVRPAMVSGSLPFYYLVLIVFIILLAAMYRLVNSPFGLTLKGIRESESRMSMLGYNTTLHKFIGFTATGIFAGLGGALYALYNGFVSPVTVDFTTSAEAVLMVIVGGVGTLIGPVVGAGVIIFSQDIISLYTSRWTTVMGLIFVITILFARDGIVGGLRRLFVRLTARRGAISSDEDTTVPDTIDIKTQPISKGTKLSRP